MKGTKLYYIYVGFTWAGELRETKARLQKPTPGHIQSSGFFIWHEKGSLEFRSVEILPWRWERIWSRAFYTNKQQQICFNRLKNIFQSGIQNSSLKNWNYTVARMYLSFVNQNSRQKITLSNFTFSLHSSSFNFLATFISLTPVLLIGEQYKYIPECKLVNSFKPTQFTFWYRSLTFAYYA